jgi:hypothetical protein
MVQVSERSRLGKCGEPRKSRVNHYQLSAVGYRLACCSALGFLDPAPAHCGRLASAGRCWQKCSYEAMKSSAGQATRLTLGTV